MPNPLSMIMAGVSIAGTVGSAVVQSGAASDAAASQVEAADKGVAEQRRQFDLVQKVLSPYVEAGDTALTSQLNLLGLGGADAEKAAIDRISGGSNYLTQVAEGENAILQNASATGGIRGGNTQAALAQYRPALLNNLIQQQVGDFGNIATRGQNAAAQTGTAAQNTGNQVSNLYGQVGAAQAGNALAQGKVGSNLFSGLSQIGGQLAGSVPATSSLRTPF